jgi:pimeloyl-ACP methyl ester carboxylesterase
MPFFENGDVNLYYEDHGEGFPVLLIAPGGMQSAVSFWKDMPWNPITHLQSDFRVIAMDQRNAGQSTAPISGNDGWATYTADQLALLDHLGIDRFHVVGMCIGGSYIMALIDAAPGRVASAVVMQTIGVDANRQVFFDMFDDWANPLKAGHPGVPEADWGRFRANMYDTDDFLFTVDADWVKTCTTPLLVLMGNDIYHPESSSRTLAELAPNAVLIEEWKQSPQREAAMDATRGFLTVNSN